MTEWFVHQRGGAHIGPVSTELLARGVQAGKVPADAYVAARDGGGWVPLSSVPELTAAIAAPPAPIEPPRTIPPAPPPVTTLPPPAPPLPYRRLIPLGVFAVFVFFTVVAIAISSAPKPAVQEPR